MPSEVLVRWVKGAGMGSPWCLVVGERIMAYILECRLHAPCPKCGFEGKVVWRLQCWCRGVVPATREPEEYGSLEDAKRAGLDFVRVNHGVTP